MSFKVQRRENGGRSLVLSVSGRIQTEHTETLRELLGPKAGNRILDLAEVTLVDRDAVRFLAQCEADGVTLRNCPAYVREWVCRER
jgi:anti-anti-sigma regulatory factor